MDEILIDDTPCANGCCRAAIYRVIGDTKIKIMLASDAVIATNKVLVMVNKTNRPHRVTIKIGEDFNQSFSAVPGMEIT